MTWATPLKPEAQPPADSKTSAMQQRAAAPTHYLRRVLPIVLPTAHTPAARHVGSLGGSYFGSLLPFLGWELLRVLTATAGVEVAHLGVDELAQRLL